MWYHNAKNCNEREIIKKRKKNFSVRVAGKGIRLKKHLLCNFSSVQVEINFIHDQNDTVIIYLNLDLELDPHTDLNIFLQTSLRNMGWTSW
jgi:hypothetical protein